MRQKFLVDNYIERYLLRRVLSMENKNYIVYMHISPSNKRYIGITSQKPNRRWRNGKAYKHNDYFTKSINKYGWDNFKHIILFEELTKEEAINIEEELIAKYDTTNRDKGYNILKKGDIIGVDNSGENSYWYGKHLPEEHRKKIGESRKGKYTGENHPNYGKPMSEEQKIKISETKNNKSDEEKKSINSKISKVRKEKGLAKGKNNPSAKTVICITTREIFDTMREASERYKCYKCNETAISMCCNGKRNYAGKLEDGTPLVWKKLKDYLDDNEVA